MLVESGLSLMANITMYDNEGRLFDNFTSLEIGWASDKKNDISVASVFSWFLPLKNNKQRKHIGMVKIILSIRKPFLFIFKLHES